VTRASATPAGTLVLDSEGLAKAVLRAREVTQWLALARADDLRVITSAATVVEVAHPRLSRPALEWTLSRIVVEPVTEPIARRATAILAEAGLHGHRHAVDAMLSATALAAPGPVTILTSDPEDIATLCGRNVTVIKVLRDGPGNCLAIRGVPGFFQGAPKALQRRFRTDVCTERGCGQARMEVCSISLSKITSRSSPPVAIRIACSAISGGSPAHNWSTSVR